MRKRYACTPQGNFVKTADIYTVDEHGITKRDIDSNVLNIVQRLRKHSYEAYIVGGAVRDLLLKKTPKDFDVVTNATPNAIRRIFRNSRIIGKRFRLVHVFFKNIIVEVATFRSQEAEGFKNVYGTLEEDVWRRDFRINALYFNPINTTIIDYTHGMWDIRHKVLNILPSRNRLFINDPVCIIRAVKYAVIHELRIPLRVRRRIKRSKHLLTDISISRITEEVFKIFGSGKMEAVFNTLMNFQVLEYIMPATAKQWKTPIGAEIRQDMERMDNAARTVERYEYIAALMAHYLRTKPNQEDAYFYIKSFLKPVTPANKDIEKAILMFSKRRPASRSRKRRRRTRSNTEISG